MDLSVIIVSYNVRYFLEQAVHSIKKALHNIHGEIIVIDNASTDGTVNYLKHQKNLKVFYNTRNLGFAAANNQGLKLAKGQYIALVNPDTILSPDSFTKALEHFSQHERTGALGVQMRDGRGIFLKESKRGFPTPWAAFGKFSGLSSLFSHSPLFNQYHLGWLEKDREHKVDVLCGAFMIMPKEVTEKVGGLDEDFFMYGEDIDLSYRIKMAGYEVIYKGDISIIHFKGESSRGLDLRYIRRFYRAMLIFVKKHFSPHSATFYRLLLAPAIYFRGGMAAINRMMSPAAVKVVFYLLILALCAGTTALYGWLRFDDWWYYPWQYYTVNLPLYSLVYIICNEKLGAFSPRRRAIKLLRSLLLATVIILAAYALLNDEWRFSRALIPIYTLILYPVLYLLLSSLARGKFRSRSSPTNVITVGSASESARALDIFQRYKVNVTHIGRLGSDSDFGNPEDLPPLVDHHNVSVVILCEPANDPAYIIDTICNTGHVAEIIFLPKQDDLLFGPGHGKVPGERYFETISFDLMKWYNRFLKRSFDIITAVILLILYPVLSWFLHYTWNDLFMVLFNGFTWIGYNHNDLNQEKLPLIRPALYPVITSSNPRIAARYNLLYTMQYSVLKDFQLLSSRLTQ